MILAEQRRMEREDEMIEDAKKGKDKSKTKLPKPISKMTAEEYKRYLSRHGV